MGDGDLRTTLVTGARLICGWACTAVAVLDLLTGFETGLYLAFHLVFLVGGLLLLARKPLKPFEYAVVTALAVLTTVVAALPSAERACCMRGLDVRHGFPLTVLGWNHGQQHHFAAAHTVSDLVFWFLAWMIAAVALVTVGPWGRRHRHPTPGEPAAFGDAPAIARLNHGESGESGSLSTTPPADNIEPGHRTIT
jgi:hypothetical protein